MFITAVNRCAAQRREIGVRMCRSPTLAHRTRKNGAPSFCVTCVASDWLFAGARFQVFYFLIQPLR